MQRYSLRKLLSRVFCVIYVKSHPDYSQKVLFNTKLYIILLKSTKINNYLCIRMKKTTTYRALIRFRRWSRKRYAMFSSLGCCVTIGYLKKSVVDASLKKQKSPAQTTLLQPTDDMGKEVDDREEELSGVLLQIYSLLVQPQVTNETCPIELTGTLYQRTNFAG